jgi:protein-disulfide isomerase
MANDEHNTGRWVDDRLAGLDSGTDWNPDPARGLARLRDRQRASRRHRIEWIAASLAGFAACIVLVLFQSPGACAHPRGCPADPGPAPAPVVNFKETGSAAAPVVVEIYSDFECSPCATFYKDTVPQLTEQYVNTGKVRLVHRDFPLPLHAHAREAARYANAAGTVGRYDLVAAQLFRTQSIWSRDGSVDMQVAQVLTPQEMRKVRSLAAAGSAADEPIAGDRKLAARDRVDQTPTVVIVTRGERHALNGVPRFSDLRAYLDPLLAR